MGMREKGSTFGRRFPRGTAGISVIEVLFAVSLLAISLTGAYLMISQSSRLLLAARDHYVATTLCLARIERARNVDYSLLPLLAESAPGTRVDQDGVPDENGNFRRVTMVSTNSPSSGTTSIDVTVKIRDRFQGTFDTSHETMSCIYTDYIIL